MFFRKALAKATNTLLFILTSYVINQGFQMRYYVNLYLKEYQKYNKG